MSQLIFSPWKIQNCPWKVWFDKAVPENVHCLNGCCHLRITGIWEHTVAKLLFSEALISQLFVCLFACLFICLFIQDWKLTYRILVRIHTYPRIFAHIIKACLYPLIFFLFSHTEKDNLNIKLHRTLYAYAHGAHTYILNFWMMKRKMDWQAS